jgi:23S rRNA (uridine2552-2'-O)-methyltransferase
MPTYEPRDKYYRKARKQGLPSRAAFKIEELIERKKLVHPGARIVDLGCAPGGWLVMLARAAAPNGKVVGVDVTACTNPPPGVVTIQGDITDAQIIEQTLMAIGGPADLVTSDLSPKLTGIKERDTARARELLSAALQFGARALKPHGAMVAKVFMASDFKKIVADFEIHFSSVEVTRTAATRSGSAELYLVARGFSR